jgi:hypothetical protein
MTAGIEAELTALTGEFLAALSFEHGERPRYEKIRELFIAEGRLIKNSSESPEISGVVEFIEPRRRSVDSGGLTSFHESETAAITEVFGNVAHRFSTYEKRGVLNGAPFAARGVISTQFIRTPCGWRMSSMAWDDERAGLALLGRYAPT